MWVPCINIHPIQTSSWGFFKTQLCTSTHSPRDNDTARYVALKISMPTCERMKTGNKPTFPGCYCGKTVDLVDQGTPRGPWRANWKLLLKINSKQKIRLYLINFYSLSKCQKRRTEVNLYYLTSWIRMLWFLRPGSVADLLENWIKKMIVTTVGEDAEEPECPYTAGKDGKWHKRKAVSLKDKKFP